MTSADCDDEGALGAVERLGPTGEKLGENSAPGAVAVTDDNAAPWLAPPVAAVAVPHTVALFKGA